jgi:siroheme synthase (precorrin-2 oxidase/ferrochelatase)
MVGYPLILNLKGRTARVVGIDRIGRRKAKALVEAGARVLGVDPQADLFDPDPAAGIELQVEPKQFAKPFGSLSSKIYPECRSDGE